MAKRHYFPKLAPSTIPRRIEISSPEVDMKVVHKAYVLIALLGISGASMGTPDQDQVVAVTVEPKEAYIENRGSERRLNFDLLLRKPRLRFC
jgi:hypothetical protein